jgi:hypothetical protein
MRHGAAEPHDREAPTQCVVAAAQCPTHSFDRAVKLAKLRENSGERVGWNGTVATADKQLNSIRSLDQL